VQHDRDIDSVIQHLRDGRCAAGHTVAIALSLTPQGG